MKTLLVACLLVYLTTSIFSLLLGRRSRLCGLVNGVGAVGAAILGLIPVAGVLGGTPPVDIKADWGFPIGSFHLHLDVLSAWFCIPVLLISAFATVYGAGYMRHYGNSYKVNFNWFFFQLLAGGMLLVLVAWDGMLFLIAWEIMSMAAWFLIMFDHENKAVQRAGWIYLVATHLGTAFLFFMFVMLGSRAGSFDFSSFAGLSISANLIFLLAVVGFGTKAGFFGLHVWLPEAHPAAPSHVSGLMSGVMITTGIYGILRIMTMLSTWSDWWGWLLIGIGAFSGLVGVLFALVQHDLKRLLAYSSVENIGIICLGIGLGILGAQHHNPVAILGFAGALLHILNHAIFKTVLFMGAGAVMHATGTREIDRLGGLGKRMPFTSIAFVTASAAICGLPPLNGFVSELLIYLASYKCLMFDQLPVMSMVIGGFVVIATLGLIGGFAAICFTKVVGTVFLGQPRHECSTQAREVTASMYLPMLVLAAGCVVFGLIGFLSIRVIAPVVGVIHPVGVALSTSAPLQEASLILINITLIGLGFGAVFCLLWLVRSRLLKNRTVRTGPTWGCGYSCAKPRMQYTGSSFVQPLLAAFRSIIRPEITGEKPSGFLPSKAHYSSRTPDPLMKGLYEPFFVAMAAAFGWLRRIQNGRIHFYVLYIVLTVAAVLLWSFLCPTL